MAIYLLRISTVYQTHALIYLAMNPTGRAAAEPGVGRMKNTEMTMQMQ